MLIRSFSELTGTWTSALLPSVLTLTTFRKPTHIPVTALLRNVLSYSPFYSSFMNVYKKKQLKQEGLVGHDFLLGVDFAANNVQCVHNSLKLYSNIPLSLVTIDILRQDEREEIDKVFDDVSEIMHVNSRARGPNLDADTFNGIPSSGSLRCFQKLFLIIFAQKGPFVEIFSRSPKL